MTIDEAIEKYKIMSQKGHILFPQRPDIAEKSNKDYCQTAEWLEELKELRKQQTEAEICRKFAHELKETFNQEYPSNYPSTKPYFTLENVRKLVDEVLTEMEKE